MFSVQTEYHVYLLLSGFIRPTSNEKDILDMFSLEMALG